MADSGPVVQPLIRIESVSKHFGGVQAVSDLSLDIEPGRFFALLGPSGSGKSTLMRMIAGFETPDAGRILIDGVDMAAVPPHRRPVNMMFQSYALFPHLDVARNIGFGLVQAGLSKAAIATRVDEMLHLVQLQGLERRKPDQLSGGQRQRVALARALARGPKVLLLDEPMAALDRKLREETQLELMRVQRDTGTSFVVVTHDQDEAMVMASRMAVMNQGCIEQIGSPQEIFDKPVSRYVAGFLGDTNFLPSRIVSLTDDGCDVSLPGNVVMRIADDRAHLSSFRVGQEVTLSVRPHRMKIVPVPQGLLSGVVAELVYRGDTSWLRIDLVSGERVRIACGHGAGLPQVGDRIGVLIEADAVRVLA